MQYTPAYYTWGDVVVNPKNYRFWRSVAKAFGLKDYKVVEAKDMQDLSVVLGVYQTRTQALNNGKISGNIPFGYNRIYLTKKACFDVYHPVPVRKA